MKSNAGAGAIAAGVAALVAILFIIYHFTLGASNPNQKPITADNRPEYVKRLQAGQATTYYGQDPAKVRPQGR
ncbi:MAG TPA: hypothetical protein VGS41_07490 [Chthonomonadales bacterium]|nr:hypothetical protein [Chthonomonadales bacterium]